MYTLQFFHWLGVKHQVTYLPTYRFSFQFHAFPWCCCCCCWVALSQQQPSPWWCSAHNVPVHTAVPATTVSWQLLRFSANSCFPCLWVLLLMRLGIPWHLGCFWHCPSLCCHCSHRLLCLWQGDQTAKLKLLLVIKTVDPKCATCNIIIIMSCKSLECLQRPTDSCILYLQKHSHLYTRRI